MILEKLKKKNFYKDFKSHQKEFIFIQNLYLHWVVKFDTNTSITAYVYFTWIILVERVGERAREREFINTTQIAKNLSTFSSVFYCSRKWNVLIWFWCLVGLYFTKTLYKQAYTKIIFGRGLLFNKKRTYRFTHC